MEPAPSSDTPPPPISSVAYKAYQQTTGASTALVEEHLPLVRQVVGRIKLSLPPRRSMRMIFTPLACWV